MSRPVKMKEVRTENVHQISAGAQPMHLGARQGHQTIVMLRPVGGTMTREETIALVAWLILVAELDADEVAATMMRIECEHG